MIIPIDISTFPQPPKSRDNPRQFDQKPHVAAGNLMPANGNLNNFQMKLLRQQQELEIEEVSALRALPGRALRGRRAEHFEAALGVHHVNAQAAAAAPAKRRPASPRCHCRERLTSALGKSREPTARSAPAAMAAMSREHSQWARSSESANSSKLPRAAVMPIATAAPFPHCDHAARVAVAANAQRCLPTTSAVSSRLPSSTTITSIRPFRAALEIRSNGRQGRRQPQGLVKRGQDHGESEAGHEK